MPLEGVVHALGNVHRALVDGGLLLDVHPVPPAEEAWAEGRALGRVNADEFFADVAETERLLAASGLFELERELAVTVVERFDEVDEAIENMANRRRMHLPRELERTLCSIRPPVDFHERVAFRRFRKLPGAV